MIKVALSYPGETARLRVDTASAKLSAASYITNILAPYGGYVDSLVRMKASPHGSKHYDATRTNPKNMPTQRRDALRKAGSQVLLVVGADLATPLDTAVDVLLAKILQEDTADSSTRLYEEICIDNPDACGLPAELLAIYGVVAASESRLLNQGVDLANLFEPMAAKNLDGPESGVKLRLPDEIAVKPRY